MSGNTNNSDMRDKNGTIRDERLPRWWDRWVNPTTVLTLIGGVVWGVQLNMMVVELAEESAANNAIQERLRQEISDFRVNQEKHTLILDNLVRDVSGIRYDIDAHNKEAEAWKQRILRNELMRENGFRSQGTP